MVAIYILLIFNKITLFLQKSKLITLRLTIQANGNIRLLQSKLSIDLKAMHGL